MSLRMLTTLCHIASQISYRWRPAPYDPDDSKFPPDFCEEEINLAQIPEGVWSSLVKQLVSGQYENGSWLPDYFAKADPNGEKLLQTTVRHLKSVREAGANYLTIYDSLYPRSLRGLKDPPLGLTVRGRSKEILAKPMVSVIGSRKGSGFAIQESFRLGALLADLGIVTVSGGALGCDIAAHHGVLSKTAGEALAIGVFAGGLNRLYPIGNNGIFRKLEERGAAFISERLWWAPALKHDFPVRNRLISGLSGVTFVVQAGQPSGAYLTAKMALDQGRDVAILRHPAHDVRAEGSRSLAWDGAREFQDVDQFIRSIEVVPSAP